MMFYAQPAITVISGRWESKGERGNSWEERDRDRET